MTDLLSLLCEAAGDFDDLEDPRIAKRPKTLKPTLSSISGSPSLGNVESPRRGRSSSNGVHSSSPFQRSPQHTGLNFGFEEFKEANEPVSPMDSSSVTSGGVDSESSGGGGASQGRESSSLFGRSLAPGASSHGSRMADVSAGKADAWSDGGAWSGEEEGEVVESGEYVRTSMDGVESFSDKTRVHQQQQHQQQARRSRSQPMGGAGESGIVSTLVGFSSPPSTSSTSNVHQAHHIHLNRPSPSGSVVVQVGNSIIGVVNNTNGVLAQQHHHSMDVSDSAGYAGDAGMMAQATQAIQAMQAQNHPSASSAGLNAHPISSSFPSSSSSGASSFMSSNFNGAGAGVSAGAAGNGISTSPPNSPSSLILNCKKRKRVTKQSSRRAKPLTVDILFQIFEKMGIFQNEAHCGTYKLVLPTLKSAECSSIYFAVTEWQCFRKRIMNHGFEIVDEQPSSWIRVRPNLVTHDGALIFEDEELRHKYATPCKIKSARERNEILEIGPLDPSSLPIKSDHSSSISSSTSAMMDDEDDDVGDEEDMQNSASISALPGDDHLPRTSEFEVFNHQDEGFASNSGKQTKNLSSSKRASPSFNGSPRLPFNQNFSSSTSSASSPFVTMMMTEMMMTEDSNGSSSSSHSADEADETHSLPESHIGPNHHHATTVGSLKSRIGQASSASSLHHPIPPTSFSSSSSSSSPPIPHAFSPQMIAGRRRSVSHRKQMASLSNSDIVGGSDSFISGVGSVEHSSPASNPLAFGYHHMGSSPVIGSSFLQVGQQSQQAPQSQQVSPRSGGMTFGWGSGPTTTMSIPINGNLGHSTSSGSSAASSTLPSPSSSPLNATPSFSAMSSSPMSSIFNHHPYHNSAQFGLSHGQLASSSSLSSPRSPSSSSATNPLACGNGMLMSSLLSSMNIQSPSVSSSPISSSSGFGASFMHLASQQYSLQNRQPQPPHNDHSSKGDDSELNSNPSLASPSSSSSSPAPHHPLQPLDGSNNNSMLEGALMNCLPLPVVVRELLTSGQYSMSNGQFEIQVTMKNGAAGVGNVVGNQTSPSSPPSSSSSALLHDSNSSRSPRFLPFSALSSGIAAE